MVSKLEGSNRLIWFWTMGSYVLAQGIVAVGALVRIPLLVDNLGAEGYGRFTAVFSVWPIIAILLDGLQQATRSAIANKPEARPGSLVKLFSKFALAESTLMFACFITPVAIAAALMDASSTEILLAVLIILIVMAICLPLAPSKGALDALSKTAFSNLSLASNTIVGLPILAVAFIVSDSIFAAVAASALGNAAPYLITSLYFKRLDSQHEWTFSRPSPLDKTTRALIGSMTIYAAANLLAYGFDPIIISVISGDLQVGEYGLASKVMMIAMFVPIGLTGLLTTKYAAVRQQNSLTLTRQWLIRTTLAFSFMGILLCGVSLVAAPVVARILSHGEIEPPTDLLVALSVFSFMAISSCPLMCAFSNHRAARVRAKTAIAAGLFNIAGTIPLTIVAGATGAVIASCIANSMLIVVLYRRAAVDTTLVFVISDRERQGANL
ncbi:oligosaccharide flippase family protein [Rhodococcus sp. ARC_M12]|uniref:lipopolysaccharide biosynthesis protein n=1 Tax=Rhodococcus sp. ARC_M12 TaxID=2928854 RepID=UPI001FB2A4D8|nr:oligosaccharide flippase family protein [Rhodococcus sp. ARC_M12]MCJ0978360.1 oligosaccharide flippase family protein [Rhodococcus sp. ARC_M12]